AGATGRAARPGDDLPQGAREAARGSLPQLRGAGGRFAALAGGGAGRGATVAAPRATAALGPAQPPRGGVAVAGDGVADPGHGGVFLVLGPGAGGGPKGESLCRGGQGGSGA